MSRGVCEVENGTLKAVHETKRIQMYENGEFKDLDRDTVLDPDVPVSMNIWGFTPEMFPVMREYFEDFLRSAAAADLKAECLLPVMVDDLLRKKKLEVSVLTSSAKWSGMTYQEDKSLVAREMKQLHERGLYPANLRAAAQW